MSESAVPYLTQPSKKQGQIRTYTFNRLQWSNLNQSFVFINVAAQHFKETETRLLSIDEASS